MRLECLLDPLWIPDVDGWWVSVGGLSDDVVGNAVWSPFDRLDDVECCGDISPLCSAVWNIYIFNILIIHKLYKK